MNKQEKYCKKDTKILQTIKNCVTPVYKALLNTDALPNKRTMLLWFAIKKDLTKFKIVY